MTAPQLPARIDTARLTLRAPELGDLDELVRLANNWKVIEPTASLPFPYLAEHGHGYIERVSRLPDRRSYAMTDHQDRFLGVIGLQFSPDQSPELGYWLGEPHWGQGLATEAIAGLLGAAGAAGIARLRARVLSANLASLRVLEKTGFVVSEHTTSLVERHLGQKLTLLAWEGRPW